MTDVTLDHSPPPAAVGDDPTRWTLKMKELCERAGVTRQSVHFYIKEGLLPAGRKRGRNMAYYGEVHVRRLELIRQLQDERFMPLKAIKALLDGRETHFTPEQHGWLDEVKRDLPEPLRPDQARGAKVVDAAEVHARYGVTADELTELASYQFIGLRQTADGLTLVADSDLWMVALWAEIKAEGFTELGLTMGDLTIFQDTIAQLFTRETALFARLMSGLAPADAAQRLGLSVNLVNRFMAAMHRTKVQQFFELGPSTSARTDKETP